MISLWQAGRRTQMQDTQRNKLKEAAEKTPQTINLTINNKPKIETNTKHQETWRQETRDEEHGGKHTKTPQGLNTQTDNERMGNR